ncbi:hypothetical protein C1878_13885 [Gordonibacter sp. 28C]|nr:hypothetical protein C1878_13885 [Gordonibacter sp. 28C]
MCDRWLWAFLAYGLISVVFSYMSFYSSLGLSSDVLFNASFIPRQAYYFFFIPLIIASTRHPSSESCRKFLCRKYRLLFFCIYVAHVLWTGGFALDVSSCFCLSLLLLLNKRKQEVIDLLFLGVVLLSPMAVGGEMTQAAIRLVCLVFYFAKNKESVFRYGMFAVLAIVIACFIVPFVPFGDLGLDANTSWRISYWRDELDQLLATYGMGVGYGTSYASYSFIGSATFGPFAATEQYSTLEKMYVVGCHNSFISLAFRLGIAGVSLLLAYILSLASRKRSYREGFTSSACFAVISSLIIICFNVGFESPAYFFLFAFSVSYLNSAITLREAGSYSIEADRGHRLNMTNFAGMGGAEVFLHHGVISETVKRAHTWLGCHLVTKGA